MDNSRELTVPEIVATLTHSNRPCLLVEGRDDMAIYRLVAEKAGADIISCGGREKLFKVYSQRGKFANKRVVFFADKDTFIFEGVPEEYSGIIFTHGYSIENDILDTQKLFDWYDQNEMEIYEAFLDQLSLWWAQELICYYSGCHNNLAKKIDAIIKPLPKKRITPSDIKIQQVLIDSSLNSEQLIQTIEIIRANFALSFRGHSLLRIHQLIFSKKENKGEASLARGLLLMLTHLGDSVFLEYDIYNIRCMLNCMSSQIQRSWLNSIVKLPFDTYNN